MRKRVDLMARIPMRGRVASLNASVAGSVFLFEAAAQRGRPESEHPDGRCGAAATFRPGSTRRLDRAGPAGASAEPATRTERCQPTVVAQETRPADRATGRGTETGVDVDDLLPEAPPIEAASIEPR